MKRTNKNSLASLFTSRHPYICYQSFSDFMKDVLWQVKAWRMCVRKYTEIIEDYGGMANGCQLSLLAKEWSVGQRTSR